MLHDRKIGVIIPAFNEESFIENTIRGVPAFIDHIIVINDGSLDRTAEIVERLRSSRLSIIHHAQRIGVGRALRSGYTRSLQLQSDIVVVMDGDGQMSPKDLPQLIEPIIRGDADYTKGNRFHSWDGIWIVPFFRLLGNAVLSLITQITTGYWQVRDSQCGFTAIHFELLKRIDLDSLFPTFGVYNDLLFRIREVGGRVTSVPVQAIYDGQRSQLRPIPDGFKVFWLLLRSARKHRSKNPTWVRNNERISESDMNSST